MIAVDRRLPLWPTATITVVAGGFVAAVTAAWVWSHVLHGAEIDDVALIIAFATVARAVSIIVSIGGVAERAPAPRLLNTTLAGFGAAQVIYPLAEAVVKLLVVIGVIESGTAGVRNLSATGWFNFAAVVVVFGLPGAMFLVQARQHARIHRLALRYQGVGATAGLIALLAIGLLIGSE